METCTSYVAMILVQFCYGISNILVKIALARGLNQLVFVIYRHLIAMFVLGPFAYVFERKQRPLLTVKVFVKIFVLASLGTTIHLNMYYCGLQYTSATVASALNNVSPSLTFLMALLFGMETVKITSARGCAKLFGTTICIGGSLIFTFWKGAYLFKSFEDKPLINMYSTQGSSGESGHVKENWIKGSTLILTSHIAWSLWLILQASIYKDYPARLSLNTLICFIASVQSSILALFFGRDPAIWKLGWNVQLLAIIYGGVVSSGLVYYLQTWAISKRGPVFSAVFSPVLLIIVAIFSAIAFAERLHVGSLVGAILIIVGLYCVLWGKSRDHLTAQPEEEKGFAATAKSPGLAIEANGKPVEVCMHDCSSTNPVTTEKQ